MKQLSIKEAVENTRDAVLSGSWTQWRASLPSRWREMQDIEKRPNCIGMKLYMHFFRNRESSGYLPEYLEGLDAFAASMGANRAQLMLMCQQFCSRNDPFSGTSWTVSREEAWDTLAKCTYVPHTHGADLHYVNLSYADLRDTDLSRANLQGSELRHANLSVSNLQQARLSLADLSGADLDCANLNRADLHGANLSRANLEGANLRYANLCSVDVEFAYYRAVKIDGAEFNYEGQSEILFKEELL